MWWLAAACFVVAAFLFFCVPVTRYRSPWYREQIRLSTHGQMWNCASSGQHVAVKIKNPHRSWVHGRGPQQKSTFLPWTGVLKGGFGCIRGVVLGHLARTKMLGLPERFGVARLLEDIVELVYMGYFLSVIRGLVHSLPCSRVAQIGRKTVRTWISLRKNRMVDDKKDLRPKPRNGGSGARRGRSDGRRDSGWRNRGRGSTRKCSSSSSSSSSPSRRKRRGKQQKVKEVQTSLEKHDPQYQQWKEEAKKKERAVELQEQAEVLAKVMKEHFDHTIHALSPALVSAPPFPLSPPGVPSVRYAVEERREQNDLLGGLHNFDGCKRSCCTRCPLFGTGSQEMSSSKLLGSSSGTAGSWRPWVNSLLVMVVEQPSPERRRRDQAWYLTLHANNELSCPPPLKVFGRLGVWSWCVDSSCFSWDCILGILA